MSVRLIHERAGVVARQNSYRADSLMIFTSEELRESSKANARKEACYAKSL